MLKVFQPFHLLLLKSFIYSYQKVTSYTNGYTGLVYPGKVIHSRLHYLHSSNSSINNTKLANTGKMSFQKKTQECKTN